jgi:hypothetical protein
MSPWQEWKKRNLEAQQQGRVTPAALLNPDTPEASDEVVSSRLAICEQCPHFSVTKQCKKCGCFMPAKTKLLHASCPLGEW